MYNVSFIYLLLISFVVLCMRFIETAGGTGTITVITGFTLALGGGGGGGALSTRLLLITVNVISFNCRHW